MTPLDLKTLLQARDDLLRERPFLSILLHSLKPVEVPSFDSLAVSRDLRLFWGPLTPFRGEELKGVLIHESMHILSEHFARRGAALVKVSASSNRDAYHKIINIAEDLEINDDLEDAKIPLPAGALYPQNFKLSKYQTAEVYMLNLSEVYMLNLSRDSVLDTPPNICGHARIASTNKCPDGSSDFPTEESKEKTKKILEKTYEVAEHFASAPGTGDLCRAVISLARKQKPPTNWRRSLAFSLRGKISSLSGAVDYTYTRASRRSQCTGGVILPSLHKPLPKVVVVLDISSSMSGPPSEISVSAIQEIIHAVGVEGITIIPTNVKAHPPIFVRRGTVENIEFSGGTNMPPGIKAAEELSPDILITVTDGETAWPHTREGSCYYIAAIVGREEEGVRRIKKNYPIPDWMEIIDVLME